MSLPHWVAFEAAERTAAVMARGLSGPSESWGTLLAHAQGILDSYTDTPDAGFQDSYQFENWSALIAAGRILDQASTRNGISNPEHRTTTAVLAACAFGMSGTAVSAGAVIREHDLLAHGLTPGELTALALSSPAQSREIFPILPPGSAYRACVEHVAGFLAQGHQREIEAARTMLKEATEQEWDPWSGYLLRLSRLSMEHVARLSTIRLLEPHRGRFPEGYLDRLVDEAPMLLPSQYEAVKNKGILDRERNILVSLPTGTGKTLLGELALMSAIGTEPGLVCYVAPYVALGRQVRERMLRHAPRGVRVTPLMGGFKEPTSLDPETRQEVIIATPERFDAIIRLRNDLLPSLRCVVFDEAHMVGNGQRGIRLESIITRLKLNATHEPDAPRFVLLSAVLSNTNEIAKWLDIGQENIVSGTWRPTTKRVLHWTDDGILRLCAGDDPLRDKPAEVLGRANLPWPNTNFYPARNFGQIRTQRPQELENLAYLADFEIQQYQQPVLCVCASRSKTRQLASHIAHRLEPVEPTPEPIRRLIETIDIKHPYLLPLKNQLLRGVAYHNSSLPHEIRTGIEQAVEERCLKVVSATTTLAEGVDLPFRVTILADWLMFDGEKSSPMESLLFKNIAGRCGRAGRFTEGDTVIFDNPVGDSDLTQPNQRKTLQQDIFFSQSQPELTSAIIKEREPSSVSALGSQLLATIAENPGTENLGDTFLEHSFAHQVSNGDRTAEERVNLALREILDSSSGVPLAVAASPIHLTSFGEAVKATGLAPETAKKLWTALDDLEDVGVTKDDLVEFSQSLLTTLGEAHEQTNSDLRKAVRRPTSRPVVRLDELDHVLEGWLSGNQLHEIFATLPSKVRSTRRDRLEAWLRGDPDDNNWTNQFSAFTEFVDSVIALFLPWILRAAQTLAELKGKTEKPWTEWADFLELGVDTSWAVMLINEDIIPDRTMARPVGQAIVHWAETLDPDSEDLPRVMSEVANVDGPTLERIWMLLQDNPG